MIPSTLFCDVCGAANQPKAAFCRTCGSPLQSANPASRNTATGRLLANYVLNQRYRVLHPVGKGGMGAVYCAEDIKLGNRKVAVKEMSQSGLNPQEVKEAAEGFEREALILANLQHPNLPNIHDHFFEGGRWYLVMSFIQGESLEDYLRKAPGGKLPIDEVLQMGIQLCTVLSYLHSQQPPIIFRDLKPANIMRTLDGHLYLIDFGIARHFKPGQAKDTAAYGSMGYAPLEQWGKKQTTPRSDIYSLGVVLYQLLSGHDPSTTPFRFPPLQSLAPMVPDELARLVMQMLEMDENDRPASMLEVKQKLQGIAGSASTIIRQKPVPPPPLAPTQYVSPPPAPPPASTQVAVPVRPKPAAAPPGAAPVKVWSFGRRQLIATLVGIILCSLMYYLAYFSSGYSLLGVPLIIVPIFFGTVFGPWAGLGVASISYLVIISIRYPSVIDNPFFWKNDAIFALLGFVAGLTLLKTRGRFDSPGNIIFPTVVGLVEVGIAVLVLHFSFSATIIVLGSIVLLPLLLVAYNAICKRRNQSHP